MRVWASWVLVAAGAMALVGCGEGGGGPGESGCTPVLGGGGGAPITYVTASCWTLSIDHDTLQVRDPAQMNKYEVWGAGLESGTPHENLNGKHIKDFFGHRRTVSFGGVTLTMSSAPDEGVLTATLYDGARSYRVDTATNTVVATTEDAATTAALEAGEADGETALLTVDEGDALRFENLYEQGEDEAEGPLDKVDAPQLLGETGGAASPTQVRDYYDDERYGST